MPTHVTTASAPAPALGRGVVADDLYTRVFSAKRRRTRTRVRTAQPWPSFSSSSASTDQSQTQAPAPDGAVLYACSLA